MAHLTLAISIALFAVKAWALVDCLVRPAGDFPRANTLEKNAWIVILVLALAVHVFVSRWNPLSILSLIGTVAALVYLAQLRGSQY